MDDAVRGPCDCFWSVRPPCLRCSSVTLSVKKKSQTKQTRTKGAELYELVGQKESECRMHNPCLVFWLPRMIRRGSIQRSNDPSLSIVSLRPLSFVSLLSSTSSTQAECPAPLHPVRNSCIRSINANKKNVCGVVGQEPGDKGRDGEMSGTGGVQVLALALAAIFLCVSFHFRFSVTTVANQRRARSPRSQILRLLADMDGVDACGNCEETGAVESEREGINAWDD